MLNKYAEYRTMSEYKKWFKNGCITCVFHIVLDKLQFIHFNIFIGSVCIHVCVSVRCMLSLMPCQMLCF